MTIRLTADHNSPTNKGAVNARLGCSRKLVEYEFTQSTEEGRPAADVEALRPAFESAGTDEAKLQRVWDQLLAIPIAKDFPFVEPDDLTAIGADASRRPASRRPALWR